MNTKEQYYIIEYKYVGINRENPMWQDYDRYDITTETPTNNMGEKITTGWLGTYLDISKQAHGAYKTEEDACKAVEELITKLPKCNTTSSPPWIYTRGGWRIDDSTHPNPAVSIVYRPGKHQPITNNDLKIRIFELNNESNKNEPYKDAKKISEILKSEGYIIPDKYICKLLSTL